MCVHERQRDMGESKGGDRARPLPQHWIAFSPQTRTQSGLITVGNCKPNFLITFKFNETHRAEGVNP